MTTSNFYQLIRAFRVAVFLFMFFAAYFALIFLFRLASVGIEAGFFLGFAVVALCLPIYQIFTGAITKEGEIHVFFSHLFSNLGDFDRRQKWVNKIAQELEEKLKKAKILVRHDSLAYYLNLKLSKAPKDSALRLLYEKILIDLENWLVRDSSQDFYGSLTSIVPVDDITPFEKPSMFKSLSVYAPDIIKGIFILATVIILAAMSPDLAREIFRIFG